MNIGEFAALTGLSVKALRHYDAKGLLAPASIDPATGYRGYELGQFRAAGLIAVLRAAQLPLAAVGEVLAAEAPAALLARERLRLAEERLAQDSALAAAEWLLAGEHDAEVLRADRPEQGFAYLELPGEPELPEGASDAERAAAEEAGTEAANAAFARVHRAVLAAGGEIAGPWWFQHRLGDGAGAGAEPMTLRCAWPVRGLAAGAGGELADGVRLGTLPAATELSVDIPHGMTPEEVTIPPGQLALFSAVAEAEGEDRAELAGLRTEGRLDEAGQPVGLTLRYALGRPA